MVMVQGSDIRKHFHAKDRTHLICHNFQRGLCKQNPCHCCIGFDKFGECCNDCAPHVHSSSPSQASTGVKPWEQAARILLVASHARHESALPDASSKETGLRCGFLRFEVVLWHLEQIADFFGGPDTLDQRCAGCFFGPCTGHRPLRHGLGPATVRNKTNSRYGPGPGHMVCLTWTPRRGPTFSLLTGHWKWFLGSRSKPFFVPQGQPASYIFSPNSMAARFCTRLRLCGHCRSFSFSKASVKHSEGLVSMPARWCRTTLGTLFNCRALHCTTVSVIILGFVFAQNTALFL